MEVTSDPIVPIENNQVRPIILGDGGYPLLTWLMKPYNITRPLTQSQKKFNKTLSSARAVVERGFGILKARWRCLLKRLDANIENVSSIVVTCVVLHNIFQLSGDDYVDEDNILEGILDEVERIRN